MKTAPGTGPRTCHPDTKDLFSITNPSLMWGHPGGDSDHCFFSIDLLLVSIFPSLLNSIPWRSKLKIHISYCKNCWARKTFEEFLSWRPSYTNNFLYDEPSLVNTAIDLGLRQYFWWIAGANITMLLRLQ